MFENLSEKLQRSFKTLRGQGTLSDALLESDVNLDVTRKIIEDICAKALGTKVTTALNPRAFVAVSVFYSSASGGSETKNSDQ